MIAGDRRPSHAGAESVAVHPEPILDAIARRADELVALTLELSQLTDLSGRELPVARAVAGWLDRHGMPSTLQELGPESANVIAHVRGTRQHDIPSLMIESHLDTEGGIGAWDPKEARRLRGAWRDGDLLVGKGLVNDKVQVAAMLVAADTVLCHFGALAGDLIVVGAAQETGRVREAAEPNAATDHANRVAGPHVTENQGARELLRSGVRADYALVGEPNGFAIGGAQAGYVRLRIDVPGSIPYTPFVDRRGARPLANPFERAGRVIPALEAWCAAFQERSPFQFWGGSVVGTAQIEGIEGSGPLFTERTDWCRIFLDIRTPPETDPEAIAREVGKVVDDFGFGCEVTIYDRDIGHVATGAGRLVETIRAAHRTVFGAEALDPSPPQVSMSQDMNVFNEAGIPSVAYGIRPIPEAHTREGMRAVRVGDVVALAKVYALTIAGMCGRG